MKMIKKLALITPVLISLLFTPQHSHTMDQPNKQIGWVALAGAAILGGYAAYQQFLSYIHEEPTEPFPFMDLPKDMQVTIVSLLASNSTAKTLQEAGKTINALAQTNQYLNELINDPKFCLQIIKHLSAKFDCSDADAAWALQTQEAKQRLKLQAQLKLSSDIPYLESMIKQGIDLEFTITIPNTDGSKFFLSPLMFFVQLSDDIDAIYAFTKYVNVNRQDIYGMTALLYSINRSIVSSKRRSLFVDHKIISILLNAGADPELAHSNGLTPLQAAQDTGDQEIIDLIQDAIDKKHEKK